MQGHPARQRGVLPLIITLGAFGCSAEDTREATCLPVEPPLVEPSGDVASGISTEALEGFQDPTPCLVLEDLDGDGALDLAVGERGGAAPGIVSRWGGVGSASEQSSLLLPAGAVPSAACTAMNLDDDDALELLVGTESGALWEVDGLDVRAPLARSSTLALPPEAAALSLKRPTTVLAPL